MLLDRQPRKVLKEDAVRYKCSSLAKVSKRFHINLELTQNMNEFLDSMLLKLLLHSNIFTVKASHSTSASVTSKISDARNLDMILS